MEHFWVSDNNQDRLFGYVPPRDIARLRRDLRHVVIMTEEPERYFRHPENVLFVDSNSWRMNPKDTELFELVTVLAHLSQQKDVRPELLRYDGLDVAALAHLIARDIREDAVENRNVVEEEDE